MSKSDKLIEYLTGDSVRLDENVVEAELANIGALIQNEKVKLAYKCGRDSVICTSKRMLYLDCQGISGKEREIPFIFRISKLISVFPGNRVEYLSLRYSCIKAYEVETAGMFDLDAEFKIYTNLDFSRTCIKTEIRKDQSDIMEVLWHFNNQLLGTDDMPLEEVHCHL